MTMPSLGQTVTHNPQPLHRSVSIVILPAIFSFFASVCGLTHWILTVPQAFVKRKGTGHERNLPLKAEKGVLHLNWPDFIIRKAVFAI